MEITYTKQGDYLIPNLYLEKDKDCGTCGKYGMIRLHFIYKNKRALYISLLMQNKLIHHINSVGRACDSMFESLMEDYIKNDERLSEKNKEINTMEWTKLMNNYKNMAEELVLKEYVFA